ncbi:GDP-mannose-dependent alpha-(1-6)-phosphatidylinositol dimannoside mannosyltransferase [Actinoplanes ianthinogenes]|uniref:GDP-mannose-dependent alpha-(1-6)-phosphatidylinositol dimannoside mannosyltransferase n=1 Tax=Actinoplanes ianthinogenes TaxID=122358 RepID=A0ABM7LZP2_9ACTN|nr:glycosyltransferase [Actinoplanes ianthinogenes]BCJ44802.1 GDP-mannose-dependent alpha-(1-6)-phosphatidylinositol dimannoside mannosyltransferase [Actinoplanes ianthinogenes]GGR00079.1 GDP-mannose-dependent alpha-(1-6)-phosphatidylinositol dimannoside mannosyltransferase [Actinoplanes ianthinogenes]
MLIVRIANFVHATSGGLRTALRALGQGYQEAGHRAVLITPGPRATEQEFAYGRVLTLPGPVVPGLGGYRVLLNRVAVGGLLERLGPDRIEVHDRSTLRWLGGWGRRAGVPSMMVSHESLDGLLRMFGPGRSLGLRAADRLNARTVKAFDSVVCTTGWAEREFTRLGATPVRVPLGVDLARFTPGNRDPELRRRYAGPDGVILLHCGRLSAEKDPRLSLHALAGLRAAGTDAVLVVAGDGPLRAPLEREAAARGLPATFLGHVADPRLLAALLATADVALAPGPIETFGLAALEALASGTPVVARTSSALPEVIGDAGLPADGTGAAYTAAVRALLDRPAVARRAAARAQAERFPWSGAVDGFLAVHGLARIRGTDPAIA